MNLRREYYSLIWRTQTVGMAAQPHPKHKTPTATKTKLQFCYETNKRWPGQEKYKLQEKNQVKIKREKNTNLKKQKQKFTFLRVLFQRISILLELCCVASSFFLFLWSLGTLLLKEFLLKIKPAKEKKNLSKRREKKPFPLELYKSGMDGWNMQYVMMVLYYNEKLL